MTLKHVYYHVKRIASPGSMYETGCSELVHWDDPEGWDGEEGGRGLQDGETNFSPTNSSKEHLNTEQTPQNNF